MSHLIGCRHARKTETKFAVKHAAMNWRQISARGCVAVFDTK
jgi:hypothetical protein